jgi:hypothetical protein
LSYRLAHLVAVRAVAGGTIAALGVGRAEWSKDAVERAIRSDAAVGAANRADRQPIDQRLLAAYLRTT